MAAKKSNGKILNPQKIKNLVKNLTVLDLDVSKIENRLAKGRKLTVPGDSAGCCIIYIECCIIDCSNCTPNDRDI